MPKQNSLKPDAVLKDIKEGNSKSANRVMHDNLKSENIAHFPKNIECSMEITRMDREYLSKNSAWMAGLVENSEKPVPYRTKKETPNLKNPD